MQDFEIAVIGAGMAGASAAAFLAASLHPTGKRVALIEAEDVAGYHTTGRSAAIWIQNYGPSDVREFTRRSRSFYEAPPPGFTDIPLIRRRAVLILASTRNFPNWKPHWPPVRASAVPPSRRSARWCPLSARNTSPARP